MPSHKLPFDLGPSKLVARFGQEIAATTRGPIVDVACGYGRNACYIASFGAPVICVDIDEDALRSVSQLRTKSKLVLLRLDLEKDPWPFEPESLGAILSVDFFRAALLDHFISSLAVGGCMLIETIEGRGENYRELPPAGLIQGRLADRFEVFFCKERKVGPHDINAATMKLFAYKRRP